MYGRTCVRPRDDLMCELRAVIGGEWSLWTNVLISGKTRVGSRDDLAEAPACIFGIVMSGRVCTESRDDLATG